MKVIDVKQKGIEAYLLDENT